MKTSGFQSGRAYWRSIGRCVECGADIDNPIKYIRCADCRHAKSKRESVTQTFGKCADCGERFETFGKFVRCEKCRDVRAQEQQMRREAAKSHYPDKESERLAKIASLQIQFEKCSHCHWGRLDSGIVFCPFPQDVCLKGRIV